MTSIASPDAPQAVERDDLNNANLRVFEVTWENGAVEQIRAHHVIYPSTSAFDRDCEGLVRFTGWYDGEHRTPVAARADRIRMIRDLSMLPSLPDLDAMTAGDELAEDASATIPPAPAAEEA